MPGKPRTSIDREKKKKKAKLKAEAANSPRPE
jgi:hypothetical protein